MDRISDSDSEDAGSIPAGATILLSKLRGFFLISCQNFQEDRNSLIKGSHLLKELKSLWTKPIAENLFDPNH